MKVTAGAVVAVVGVSVAGLLAWRAYKAGGGVLATAQQAVAQVQANVQSAWVNNVSGPFQRGQDYMAGVPEYKGEKAWLYSDYGYTGVDAATGVPVVEGEWYSDAVARRYDIEQRANGTPPAATSIHGAAFGIYPQAF